MVDEEYIVETPIKKYPEYIPTPKSAGPKPITLEQYRQRQQIHSLKLQEFRQPTVFKPKKRGGKKRQHQKKCADLQRIINISQGQQKRNLVKELEKLRQDGWNSIKRGDNK